MVADFQFDGREERLQLAPRRIVIGVHCSDALLSRCHVAAQIREILLQPDYHADSLRCAVGIGNNFKNSGFQVCERLALRILRSR